MKKEWGETRSYPSSRGSELYSHVIGARYPCRSTPLVPREILAELKMSNGNKEYVLDPFMGSGTTALEASLKGYLVLGVEIDPYARMLAEASARKYRKAEILELENFATEFRKMFSGVRFSLDAVPEIPNIDLWFSQKNIRDLARLRKVITQFSKNNPRISQFALSAFGDIIRGASNAERQSLKPYVSTRFKKIPGDVLSLYGKTIERYLAGARATSAVQGYGAGKINWLGEDATDFFSKNKAVVAITSPPYINAIDYVRCIKLESAWTGMSESRSFQEIRQIQLGESARRNVAELDDETNRIIARDLYRIGKIDPKRADIVASYFSDMKNNLQAVFACLSEQGQYHIIIGNSVVRGIPVETHKHLAMIAEMVGFRWSAYFKYAVKDHRTSLQRKDRGGKISVEHVLTLAK
jgi:hypothetical protein